MKHTNKFLNLVSGLSLTVGLILYLALELFDFARDSQYRPDLILLATILFAAGLFSCLITYITKFLHNNPKQ